MNKKKGISLITLVITIVVVIILAAAVILSLSKNSPIKSARVANVMNSKDSLESAITVFVSDVKAKTQGYFSTEEILLGLASKKEDSNPIVNNGTESYSITASTFSDGMVIENGEIVELYKIDEEKATTNLGEIPNTPVKNCAWYINKDGKVYLIFDELELIPDFMVNDEGVIDDVNLKTTVAVTGEEIGSVDKTVDEAEIQAIAKIGNTEYATLDALRTALASLPSGQETVVRILKDVELSSGAPLDISSSGKVILIAQGKNINISTSVSFINVSSDSTELEIVGGNYTSTTGSAPIININSSYGIKIVNASFNMPNEVATPAIACLVKSKDIYLSNVNSNGWLSIVGSNNISLYANNITVKTTAGAPGILASNVNIINISDSYIQSLNSCILNGKEIFINNTVLNQLGGTSYGAAISSNNANVKIKDCKITAAYIAVMANDVYMENTEINEIATNRQGNPIVSVTNLYLGTDDSTYDENNVIINAKQGLGLAVSNQFFMYDGTVTTPNPLYASEPKSVVTTTGYKMVTTENSDGTLTTKLQAE